jgi:hypothetical protein
VKQLTENGTLGVNEDDEFDQGFKKQSQQYDGGCV